MTEAIGSRGWFQDKQAIFLVIKNKLPSLNEYTAKCRTNAHIGAKFKSDTELLIWQDIIVSKNAGILRPLRADEYPCKIEIYWREHTSKRDVDNIKSAAKFILDALKNYSIIKDDSQKYISQIYDHISVDKARDNCVVVKIIPKQAQE